MSPDSHYSDTIRRAIALGDYRTWAYDVSRSPRDFDDAYAALAEWKAAGERDKAEIERLRGLLYEAQQVWERDGREIARLTETLEVLVSASNWAMQRSHDGKRWVWIGPALGDVLVGARAVLAGEEDANGI